MKAFAALALVMAWVLSEVRAQQETPAPPEAVATPAALQPLSDAAEKADPADLEPPAVSSSPAGEKPSAELIIDAEEAVAKEPALPPGEEPLPQLEGKLPGEDNIFGDDLFGPTDFYSPSMPEMPSAPPLIEDPREAERKLHLKFRKITARLAGDPELVSLQEMADRAPTPEDRRAARRAYYALLYRKVRKADGALKDYADKLEEKSVANLYQTRIEPTVALNPPPEPQPNAKLIPPNEYPEVLPFDEQPVALP